MHATVNHGQVGQELSLAPRPSTLRSIHVVCGVVWGHYYSLASQLWKHLQQDDNVTPIDQDQQIFSEAWLPFES